MEDKKDIVGKLQQDLKEKLEEIKNIWNILQKLKGYDETIQVPELGSLFGAAEDAIDVKCDNIKPDYFYAMPQTEAAEKYLKMIGHAVSLDSIFSALQKGGIKFTANGKNSLNVQLTRATRKFVKMKYGEDINFGLIEWYPKRKPRSQDVAKGKTLPNVETEGQAEGKEKDSTDANQ